MNDDDDDERRQRVDRETVSFTRCHTMYVPVGKGHAVPHHVCASRQMSQSVVHHLTDVHKLSFI